MAKGGVTYPGKFAGRSGEEVPRECHFERDRLGSKTDLHAAEATIVAVGLGCRLDDGHLCFKIQLLDGKRLEFALDAVQEQGGDLLDSLPGKRQQRDDEVGIACEGL